MLFCFQFLKDSYKIYFVKKDLLPHADASPDIRKKLQSKEDILFVVFISLYSHVFIPVNLLLLYMITPEEKKKRKMLGLQEIIHGR